MTERHYIKVDSSLTIKSIEQHHEDMINMMWSMNCMLILKLRDNEPNCAVFTEDFDIHIKENEPIPDKVWKAYCAYQECPNNFIYRIKSPELALEYEMYLRRSEYGGKINCPEDCPARIDKEVPNTDGLFKYTCYFNEEINCRDGKTFPEKCVFKLKTDQKQNAHDMDVITKFKDYLNKVTEKIGYSEENLKLIDEKKNEKLYESYSKCGKLPSVESIYQMLDLDEWIKGRILEDHVKIPLYVILLYLIKNDEFNSGAYDIYKEYPFHSLEDYFWCYSVLGRSCPYLDFPK